MVRGMAVLGALEPEWMLARRRWPIDRSSLVRGAIETSSVFWPRLHPSSDGHGTEQAGGTVPLALAESLTARGRYKEAVPLVEHGVAMARVLGRPLQVAQCFSAKCRSLRALGGHTEAAAALTDLDRCSPTALILGSLAEKLSALERPVHIRRVQSEEVANRQRK